MRDPFAIETPVKRQDADLSFVIGLSETAGAITGKFPHNSGVNAWPGIAINKPLGVNLEQRLDAWNACKHNDNPVNFSMDYVGRSRRDLVPRKKSQVSHAICARQ